MVSKAEHHAARASTRKGVMRSFLWSRVVCVMSFRAVRSTALPVSATVSVGEPAVLSGCCGNVTGAVPPKWDFAPLLSRSTITCTAGSKDGSFTPDVGGDHVIADERVVAIDWDTFRSKRILLVDCFASTLAGSDDIASAWLVDGAPQKVDGRLTLLRVGDGLRADVPMNFFEQPLVANLSVLTVTGRVELGFGFQTLDGSIGTEGLFVEVSPTDFSLRIEGGPHCSHKTRCTLEAKPLPECPTGWAVSVFANSFNASVSVGCEEGGQNATHIDQQPHRLQLETAPRSAAGIPSGAVSFLVQSIEGGDVERSQHFVQQMQADVGGGGGGGAAVLGKVIVQSKWDISLLPRVLGNTADMFPVVGSKLAPDLGAAHRENLRKGILDVTLPPFNADKTGKSDSTAALQNAIDYAYVNYLVTFLPIGRYLVSDTLNATQMSRYGPMGTRFGCHVLKGELIASTPSARATLVLRDAVPAFARGSPAAPRPVVHFWHAEWWTYWRSQANINMNQEMSGIDVDLGSGNTYAVGIEHRAAQGSTIQSVTIFANDAFAGLMGGAGSGGSHIGVTVIGGRFGVDYRGAQPAATVAGFRLVSQRCAGILYCGLMSLSIVGLQLSSAERSFQHAIIAGTGDGLQLAQASQVRREEPLGECSAPTDGWCPGNPPGKINQTGTRAIHGQVSVVDSVFNVSVDTATERRTAISTSSNTLYLKNVVLRGFAMIAHFVRSGYTLELPAAHLPSRWTTVDEFAHGEPPPELSFKGWSANVTKTYQLEAPSFVDGVRSVKDLVSIAAKQTEMLRQNDLRERHLFGEEALFPSFQTADAIDVTQAPYLARGDGVHDDHAAIQAALRTAAGTAGGGVVHLPKGVYRLGATLRVPQGVALVGTAHHLCVLVPAVGMSSSVAKNGSLQAQPLVHMLPPAASENSSSVASAARRSAVPGSTLSAVMIGVWRMGPNVMAYRWDALGPGNVLRQCSTWILHPTICELGLPAADCKTNAQSHKPLPTFGGPMTEISGSGKFFVVHHEDGYFESAGYRHLLITGDGGGDRRAFYHLNPEHAQSDANMEVRDGSGVDIYGLKVGTKCHTHSTLRAAPQRSTSRTVQ